MVKPFGTSETRNRIFDGLGRYLNDCQTHGISGRIWIDGSFVTGKNDPGDVDVISLVSAEVLRRLDAADRTFALQHLNGKETTKPSYDVHSFGFVALPKSHVAYLAQAQQLANLIRFFEQTKEFKTANGATVQRPKGILQLDFGDALEISGLGHWLKEMQTEVTL